MNVAIFIDAENISHSDLPYIMMECKKFGRINVSRLYADWSVPSMEKWKQNVIHYGLEPIHCAKLPRKNSVDIKLIDDIYDILYFKNTIDIYVIVSNDIDYLTVARKVKLFGKYIFTFGYNNCSEYLKNISDRFINITLLNQEEEPVENLKSDDEDNQLELDNVFANNEDTKKTGDNFLDNIFLIMNNSRHLNLLTLKNRLKKRENITPAQIEPIIKTKYFDYFKIAEHPETKKKKIFDITSVNSDVHKTLEEQFKAVFELSDTNELLLNLFKDKLELLINNFDLRMWGFSKFKDMIEILFPDVFIITDRNIKLL